MASDRPERVEFRVDSTYAINIATRTDAGKFRLPSPRQREGVETLADKFETLADKFGPKGQPPGALALAVDPHAQDTRLAS